MSQSAKSSPRAPEQLWAPRACKADPPGERLLVSLEGRRLLSPEGVMLAQLGPDENWYTPEGLRCHALTTPSTRASAHVEPAERARARAEGDLAWIAMAIETITRLANNHEILTADDVWESVSLPPRESRMIGNALKRAQGLGLIEATDEHRRSRRSLNHKRPVRVWRSLRHERAATPANASEPGGPVAGADPAREFSPTGQAGEQTAGGQQLPASTTAEHGADHASGEHRS